MKTASQEDLNQAWEAYKQSADEEAKETLLVGYVPLVKYVAGRVSIGLPSTVDFDDLVSYGVFGLLDAVEKFQLDRGVKFETYAITRIRGAMIDGLRSFDWVPRSVRQKAKEFERQTSMLESKLGRPATDAEMCEALDMTVDEYHRLLSEVKGVTLASLDEVWSRDGDDDAKLSFGQMIEDEVSVDPSAAVNEAEVKRMLAEAIDQLPERERMVVSLYYHDELTLKEIGAVLGVTESRISQIHTKAIIRLRGRLGRFRESLVS